MANKTVILLRKVRQNTRFKKKKGYIFPLRLDSKMFISNCYKLKNICYTFSNSYKKKKKIHKPLFEFNANSISTKFSETASSAVQSDNSVSVIP